MQGPRDDGCVTQNGSTMMIEDDRCSCFCYCIRRPLLPAAPKLCSR